MKSTRTSGRLSLVALAVATSSVAMAQDSGWYGGASAGESRATIDDAGITRELLNSGLTTSVINDNKRDTGYKIFGGYQFNRNFALEGGYFNLGKFGFTATTVPVGTLAGTLKLHGFNLDAVGTLPMTEKFSIIGRVGLNYAETTDTFRGTGAVSVLDPNPSKRELNTKYGVGLEYAFTESLALRLEAERYRINDAVSNKGDIDLISLGLVFRFGGKTPAPVPYMPAPEPVAIVAEAPPPVVVAEPPPPPPPPAPTKVTISADSVFDFDKATLKPAGKAELDKFVADLNGVNYDVITITGHTDRIGSKAYNMKLSVRRAEAVQDYLIQFAGIPASKIVATGVGGSAPETSPGDCVGTKVTRALIACLQPDRRVDVEVSGTR